MITVSDAPIRVVDLNDKDRNFLEDQEFLGQEPGDDAAAILAQRDDGVFAFIEGAACPNNKRRAFPTLTRGKGLSLRLAGATVFLIAPVPLGEVQGRVAFFGWDRRENHFCATAQGGVSGDQTFLEGAFCEIGDELYLAGVLDGKVQRIVPEGFTLEYLQGLSADNPFGVEFDGAIESGALTLVGYHDYVEGGYLSAMFTWNFPGVIGMTPLLMGATGSYSAAWQDARIPVNGSTTGKKVRVQGVLTAFRQAPILQGLPLTEVPSVGYTHGTQGFMLSEGQVGAGKRPPFHPTLLRWAESIAA